MRVGLIAALRQDTEGNLRAALPFGGRSVLNRQADLLLSLGAERVICLAGSPSPEILALQHRVEGSGAAFHALPAFAALPALVRAEDDLVIIADGLVPDAEIVGAMLGGGEHLNRVVAALPGDHALAAEHPEDFERIDAARHWAGVLAMRGAPVQQLSDFPADADAVSVLLRLALQAGTPVRDLVIGEPAHENWLLATNAARVIAAEQAMIARALPSADWHAPMARLALMLARALVPGGLAQGAMVATGMGLLLLLAGVMAAALGPAAAGLALSGAGAFALQVASAFGAISLTLRAGQPGLAGRGPAFDRVSDLLAGATIWFALAPWPMWQPLAVVGFVVIGLVRLAQRGNRRWLAAAASDRAAMLILLTLAAAFGVLSEVLACLALGLLTALLLQGRET